MLNAFKNVSFLHVEFNYFLMTKVYNDAIGVVKKLLRNKKYNEAKDVCQKFLNSRTEGIYYRAFYGFYKICEAEIARESDKTDDAIRHYDEAYKRKRDRTIEGHIKYCEALEEEILAQQEYLNGNIIKACEHYQKAADRYNYCKDKTSKDWCRFLQFFLNGLVLLINPSRDHREGIRRLRQALEISPKNCLRRLNRTE